MAKPIRILISRTDRLGDVILALPVLEYLRQCFPQMEIDFLCRPNVATSIQPFLDSRKICVRPFPEAIKSLIFDGLKFENYDGALLLYEDKSVLAAARKEKIAIRIGPVSKMSSFFYLTLGLRQHRSRAIKNEAEYNLELAFLLASQFSNLAKPTGSFQIEIPKLDRDQAAANLALQQIGIAEAAKFILVHPGMGGSALNLSTNTYVEIIQFLERKFSLPILLSKGPAAEDQRLVAEIVNAAPRCRVITGVELPVLREVFRRARLVVAPSTGPLHLAHYVGTATVGIYSPVQSQRWERWRPWGGSGRSFVVAPDVLCAAKRKCLGSKCPEYFCLDRADWVGMISEAIQGLE